MKYRLVEETSRPSNSIYWYVECKFLWYWYRASTFYYKKEEAEDFYDTCVKGNFKTRRILKCT